jgi:hypothetical protein
MADVLTTLMCNLGFRVEAAAGNAGDELWLLADGHFEIRAGWLHAEHALELMGLVQPATHALDDEADDGHSWCREDIPHGTWQHTLMWHLPSSFICLVARAPASALNTASMPEFVGGFIQHLQHLQADFSAGEPTATDAEVPPCSGSR